MLEICKEIGARIASSRKKKGLSASELAKITGFAPGRISHWEQGRRLPSLESALKLQEVLDTPAAYLLAIDDELSVSNNKIHKNIPLYESTEAFDKIKVDLIAIPENLFNEHLFAVTLVDESMTPFFRQSDIVVFDSNIKPTDGDFVLLKVNATKQVLFRQFSFDYSDIKNPKFQLKPLNPSFQTITSDDQDAFDMLGVFRDELRLFI